MSLLWSANSEFFVFWWGACEDLKIRIDSFRIPILSISATEGFCLARGVLVV